MKILITGASGFIGGFFVEESLKRNYETFVAIRENSDKTYLSDSRIQFLYPNYSDKNALKTLFSQLPTFDFIIHNAGLTQSRKEKNFFTVNFEYTKNLIEALIETNRVPKKFLFNSSLASFGAGDNHSPTPVRLSDTPKPITTYGKSKLQAEQYIASLQNFPYLIFRPAAVYGPREKNLFTLFKMISKGFEPYIATKKQFLSFIFVKDLVKAFFLGMESNIENESFFVTDGKVYTSQELNFLIKKTMNKKTFSFVIPLFILRIVARINTLLKRNSILNDEKIKELECTNWRCDSSSLFEKLNFKPDFPLEKGIIETINWYKNVGWL